MFLFGSGLPSLLIATAPLLKEIALCVHVVHNNQPLYWIFLILFVPVLGSVVYLIAIVIPELTGGTRAKRMGIGARGAPGAGRGVRPAEAGPRQAKQATDETPTVQNRRRLAAAAASLGRHAEAEQLYGEAMQGIHADDPALLPGRANALIELGRAPEALPPRWPRRACWRRSAASASPMRPTSGPPAVCRVWRRWRATPRSWPASA